MKKILIFVASGYSTRMGGFPKGLARIQDVPIIINAIKNANSYFDKIVIITNSKLKESFQNVLDEFSDNIQNVLLREIVTGKGDAESVLKSLILVQEELGVGFDATFCWGDAYFATDIAFKAILSIDIEEIDSLLIGCSIDENPYAYFDIYTENGSFEIPKIKKAYFKKNDGNVPVGIHDQCIFRCHSEKFIAFLRAYQLKLGYDGQVYTLSDSGEMSLIKSVDYLYECIHSAKVCLFESGNVFSFNTQEELMGIQKRLEM